MNEEPHRSNTCRQLPCPLVAHSCRDAHRDPLIRFARLSAAYEAPSGALGRTVETPPPVHQGGSPLVSRTYGSSSVS